MRTVKHFIICMLVLALVGPATGATLYVPSVEYPSIQSAINAAVSGVDEIEVGPGIYEEAIDFLGKAIRLYSKDGRGVTTIDATNKNASVVTCKNGEGSGTKLEGFTIKGGTGTPTGIGIIKCGGGMYNDYSSPTVTDCTFTGNSAASFGGGMYNNGGSPTLTNCTFSNNEAIDSSLSAGQGGGIHNNNSSPTLTNCSFSQNTAKGAFLTPGQGAGMYNFGDSSPTLINCSFEENTATHSGSTLFGGQGAGMYNWDSHPNVTSCIFIANTSTDAPWPGEATGDGAGMYNWLSSPEVKDCNFSENEMNNVSWSSPEVRDCNFSESGMDNFAGSSPAVTDCNFSGSGMSNFAGCSPTVTDCNFSGSGMDNFGGSNPTVTDCNFSESGMGNMACSLTVTGCTFSDGRTGMFNSFSDVDVTNCTFSGNTLGAMDNIGCNINVTDCSFTNNSSVSDGGGMFNAGCYALVTNCTFTDNEADTYGGGMHNAESVTIVTDCKFQNNSANNGGGMFISLSPYSTVTNCIFSGNTASNYGGGMGNDACNPTVKDCTFNGNSAIAKGGGMSNFWAWTSVTNCKFNDNSAMGGGGIGNDYCNPTVTNCTFTENSGYLEGGGIYNWFSGPSVTNCTFSGNSAIAGGGMYNLTCYPTLTNCIFWGDTADKGPEICDEWFASPTVTYSDVQGGWGGEGNKNINPMFADDYKRLSPGSPCIDAGNNDAVTVETDLDGNPRKADGDFDGIAVVDMGAYEYVDFDADDDGIEDSVDTAPYDYSDDFDDGTTSGTIMERADQTVVVVDVPEPLGVKIEAKTSVGLAPAQVSVCGQAAFALDAGDAVIATCGSVEITVVGGTVEIVFFADDGTEAQTILSAVNTIKFEPETCTFTAPATNSKVIVVIVDGVEIVLAPGESKMFIRADIDVDPDTLNLKSKGMWITCYIELPQGFDVSDIDVSTVILNGEVPAELHPTAVGDYDGDGVADLMVKFDQAVTQAILEVGDAVQISVSGELNDGTVFEGSDTIRVIKPGGRNK